MKKLLLLLIPILICRVAYADITEPLNFQEEDGSPDTYPWRVKVTNGTLTSNADGSISISTGGGSGSPGGNNAEVQFNDASTFAGDISYTWDKTANTLSISRDAGQTGFAIKISSDTGASLAGISHDGTATFVTVDTGQGQNDLFDMDQNVLQASSPTFAGLTLSSPLTVANGGTGVATVTDGGVLIGKGTGAFENTGALAKGTIIVGDGATNPTTLASGSMGQILSVDSGATSGLKWVAFPAVATSPLTTKGDIWAYSSADARFPVGTMGQIISGDTGATFGFKWVDFPAGGAGDITAVGDCLTGACFEGSGAEGTLTTAAGSSSAGVTFAIVTGAGVHAVSGVDGGWFTVNTGNSGANGSGSGGRMVFTTGNALAGNGDGGLIEFDSGTGFGSGVGGPFQIYLGQGGATGVGGAFDLNAGPGGATSGAGGNFVINPGDASAGNSNGGDFTVNLGLKSGSGVTGTFSLNAENDAIAQAILIDAVQSSVTASDVFINFDSNEGTEGSVAGTAVAGVIAYNTFTGSHWTLTEGTPEPMMLLEITGERMTKANFASMRREVTTTKRVRNKDTKQMENVEVTRTEGPADKEYLPKTRVCTTKGSKACFGVYGGRNKDGLDSALALGTGWILVANKGRNLEAGDYLISSDVPGHAELQSDDVKRSSTVASVSENVTWKLGEQTRKVACRYLMG